MTLIVLFTFVFVFSNIDLSSSHGRLIDPPGRSSAWRFGFSTPINYNDNQLFCGGFTMQHKINGGKCGICGDPYNGDRSNELPNGRYARSLVITRKYKAGSKIVSRVQLTANHRGYFIFKLCPATRRDREVTQDCLDRYPLRVLGSRDTFRYYIPDPAARVFNVTLRLPPTLTCPRCVLQWTYVTGNNWGRCDDGRGQVGCGPQETFRACADISIRGLPSSRRPQNRPKLQKSTTTKPYKAHLIKLETNSVD